MSLTRSALVALTALLAAPAAARADDVIIMYPVHQDISLPLRAMPPVLSKGGVEEAEPVRRVRPEKITPYRADPVLQSGVTTALSATTSLNILGVGAGFVGPQGHFQVTVQPPDPNGAAGETQYVQWVNLTFAIFDKTTGAVLYGPVLGNTLWQGFGGPCEAYNNGDPNVRYDAMAGRWVLTQFATNMGPPYYQCVAVSTTSDATGSYYRYAFEYPEFNDYPKLGIWPDGYYTSYNMFVGSAFVGGEVCALDRVSMLVGAIPTQQCFHLGSAYGNLLPSDLDGRTLPPAGSPNHFVSFGTDSLLMWNFHVDWASPANTTFTGPVNILVAPFSETCGGGICVPQNGTTQKLDSLGDRLMYRLAYRNFGDHESIVANHSVVAGSSAGVRWYELRNLAGTPVVHQQGTYAPDAAWRWLGSIAMDAAGNMALGYSVSASTLLPTLRYTGRLSTDPPGTMMAETAVWAGLSPQTNSFRWGDYSAMTVDPVDDCTFWYTNEYLSGARLAWSTRITSFRFPAPAEATGLTVTKSGGTAIVGWTVAAGSSSSDLVRGLLVALPVGPGGGDEVCLANNTATTTLADSLLPAAGAGFWYLVRGESACGRGGYGFRQQNGVPTAERITTTCQ
jgi:hypothetical protein